MRWKDLWNVYVLSLEWERDGVMDGVMVVTASLYHRSTDDERG